MPAEGYLDRSVKKVSIVMPTYNRGYCLADTIQSVLSQTYKEWELLVVDNMSRDNTKEVVEGFKDKRIRLIQVRNHGVIAVSRNCGIAAATGEFIAFMDSDDPWLPEKLECSIRWLASGFDIVYHDLYITDGRVKEKKKTTQVSRTLKRPALHDLVTNGNGINTSSVVAKTELVKRVNGFSESPELIGIEDYDLWVRLAGVTDRFGFIRSPMGYYTQNGSGTLNKELIEKGLLKIADLHREIHIRICGGTPGWLNLALARICLRKDPGNAISMAGEALKRRNRFSVRIKAVAVIFLTLRERMKSMIREKIKKISS